MANTLQENTMDAIESWMSFINVGELATHPNKRTFEDGDNDEKSFLYIHSPGIDPDMEKGIGLWPVRIEIQVITNKDALTVTQHKAALAAVNAAMMDSEVAAGLTLWKANFTAYDVTPGGIEELRIDDRKWITSTMWTVLVMDQDIA